MKVVVTTRGFLQQTVMAVSVAALGCGNHLIFSLRSTHHV